MPVRTVLERRVLPWWPQEAEGLGKLRHLQGGALNMGSNVLVGFEDSLWMGPGQLAQSSAQQVQRICTVLALKGGDRVNF